MNSTGLVGFHSLCADAGATPNTKPSAADAAKPSANLASVNFGIIQSSLSASTEAANAMSSVPTRRLLTGGLVFYD
jgi:hypothetical protein